MSVSSAIPATWLQLLLFMGADMGAARVTGAERREIGFVEKGIGATWDRYKRAEEEKKVREKENEAAKKRILERQANSNDVSPRQVDLLKRLRIVFLEQ